MITIKKTKLIEQEIRPRHEPGVDHGTDGKIIIRYGKKIILWEGGCSYQSGIGREYAESCLVYQSYRVYTGHDIYRGGRNSLKRMRDYFPQIAKLMDIPVDILEQVDLKKTLVVED